MNFGRRLLILVPCLLLGNMRIDANGILLAITSGAITSALGYALWYAVLPRLHPATAAVSQLSVPLIAAAGGVLLLSEPLSWPFILAATLVLGGIGLSIAGRKS